MDYSKVKEIIELSEWEAVNIYLDFGWVLIGVCEPPANEHSPGSTATSMCYALAWTQDGDAEHPEISYEEKDIIWK